MKKLFYYLCKAINWIIPLVIAINLSKINSGFSTYVCFGYIAFAIVWLLYSSSRSRLTYQSCFFAGYILGLINIFTDNDTVLESVINATSITMVIGEKIIIVAITAVAFTSKVITMIFETKNYNAEYARRYNNRLDDEIISATYDIEYARTTAEKQRAEARLERAKMDKERYKMDEEKYRKYIKKRDKK